MGWQLETAFALYLEGEATGESATIPDEVIVHNENGSVPMLRSSNVMDDITQIGDAALQEMMMARMSRIQLGGDAINHADEESDDDLDRRFPGLKGILLTI